MKNIYINQFHTSTDRNLLPLSPGLLAAYAKQDGAIASRIRVDILIRRENPATTVARMRDPFVAGYSCYVRNLRHSLEVARLAKLAHPSVLNVVGGPSVPRRPESLAAFFRDHAFIDIAVQGEGEITFSEIIRARLDGTGYDGILGLAFRDPTAENGYVQTLARPRIKALDTLPSPYLDGTFDQLLEGNRDEVTGIIWESNRGCPFSCAFCDWGQAIQSKVNSFSAERLERELQWIADQGISYIYAADANFGIKKRDLGLVEFMAELRARTGFPGHFMINWLKNSHERVIDIVEILNNARIGCQVTLSMQSFDEATLQSIKRSNIHIDTFRDLKAEYNRRGIATYSELLLGLPGETYQSFVDGVLQVVSPYPLDHFNIYLTRILENAELSEPHFRETYALETRWCPVGMARRTNTNVTIPELEEIIVGTSTMPVSDWRRAVSFGYFLNALHNQHLFRFTLRYLVDVLGVSIQHYIEFLLDIAGEEYPAVHRVTQNIQRFQDSILANGSSVLPVDGCGDRDWEPHEASYLIAIMAGERFFEELGALTILYLNQNEIAFDDEVVAEILFFQACLVPSPRETDTRYVQFSHDIVKAAAAEKFQKPESRAVSFGFTPPEFLRADDDVGTHALKQLSLAGPAAQRICAVSEFV